jgi:hypothetical protein
MGSSSAGLLVFALALAVHLLVIPRVLGLPFRKSLPAQGVAYGLNVIVVAALVVPVVFLVVLPARARATRMSNLHLLASAMLEHADAAGGEPLLSWRVAVLPQLGEEDVYRQFKLDEPWDGPHNRALLSRMPKVYAAPGVRGAAPEGA